MLRGLDYPEGSTEGKELRVPRSLNGREGLPRPCFWSYHHSTATATGLEDPGHLCFSGACGTRNRDRGADEGLGLGG